MMVPSSVHPFLRAQNSIALNSEVVCERVGEDSLILRVSNLSALAIASPNLKERNTRIKDCLNMVLLQRLPWLLDYVLSYDSVLFLFDSHVVAFDQVVAVLQTLFKEPAVSSANALLNKPIVHHLISTATTHVIEVCYSILDDKHPNDISVVATKTGLSPTAIIALHTSLDYRVYAIGFMPNFAYLGELPSSLAVPRLLKPRARVPAGAVAIADRQTAIYPSVSPGGWHILGYTAFALSGAGQGTIGPNDSVRFQAISEQHYWTKVNGQQCSGGPQIC